MLRKIYNKAAWSEYVAVLHEHTVNTQNIGIGSSAKNQKLEYLVNF